MFLTAHEMDGFAEQDWKSLARPHATAAIYMGVRAVTFLTGRLLMHGADSSTPVTVVENASRVGQRVIATTIGELSTQVTREKIEGPAVIFLGLKPRRIKNLAMGDIVKQFKTGTQG